VCEIGTDPQELATGPGIGQITVLFVYQWRQIDLDPTQGLGKFEPIGPRVETGGEIDDTVETVGDCTLEEIIDELRARNDRPSIAGGRRHQFGYFPAAVAGQALRKRVMKQRIRPRAFPRSIDGNPAGRV
jgi:hypothetical protein